MSSLGISGQTNRYGRDGGWFTILITSLRMHVDTSAASLGDAGVLEGSVTFSPVVHGTLSTIVPLFIFTH